MTTTDDDFILPTPVRKIKVAKLHKNKNTLMILINSSITYQMIGVMDRLMPFILSVTLMLILDLW
jgi:hypothetical protein